MSKNYNKRKKIRTLDYGVILGIFAILPLFTFPYKTINSYDGYPWCTTADMTMTDLFLFGKGILLIFFLLIGIVQLTGRYKVLSHQLTVDRSIYFFLGYIAFVVMSALFSKYPGISWKGGSDQYESTWVLIAYVGICIYSSCFFLLAANSDTKLMENILQIGLPVSLIPTLLVCTGQFFGLDILGKILSAFDYTCVVMSGTVYGAFYNQNYVGSYVVLLLPLLLLFVISARRKWEKLLYIIISTMLLLSLVGSRSTTGYVSLLLILVFFCILQIHDKKSLLISGGVLILAFFVFFIVDTAKEHYYTDKLYAALHPSEETPSLESIETLDDKIEIIYKGNLLDISFDADEASDNPYNFRIVDSAQEPVEGIVNQSDGVLELQDKRFPDFIIGPAYLSDLDNLLSFYVVIDEKKWIFTNQTDGTYYYINNLGNLDKIDNAPMALFEDNPLFASGRGFLWGKTIPLLKKYIFLGAGPDTYTVIYPQSDYVNKFNSGYENTYVTRPHNMYLQMWTQTGLISLLLFLTAYGLYFIQSIRLYRYLKNKTTLWMAGTGIFYGTFGYLLAGLFNDSMVTVAPLFYVLLGIGFALNHINRSEINQN